MVGCSKSSKSDQVLVARIERVSSSLPAWQSATDTVPAQKWRLEEPMAHYHVPAVSIAVIHDGRTQWERTFGGTVREGNQIVSDETVFQAASISKALAAFVSLRVVDQELLALDIPVNRICGVGSSRIATLAPAILSPSISSWRIWLV